MDRRPSGDQGEASQEAEDRPGGRPTPAETDAATTAGDTVWVITEGDRSHTTLLLPDDYWFAKRMKEKEKKKMNTPVATNPSKAIPLVSSVEGIPLNRIRESTTNPRCQFDETKLAVLAGNTVH